MAEGREQVGRIVGGIGVEAIDGDCPFLHTDRIRRVAAEFIERVGYRLGVEITDSNYKEVLAEGKPVVVDFWAPWCGPCKMVAPIIEELAAEFEGQVIIGKCDVDENGDMAAEYGIRNIPTVLFFKNGEIVDKQVGAVAKPVFAEKVKKLL